MYDRYEVNIHSDVRNKGGLTLWQIIEAGLQALDEPYGEYTFHVFDLGEKD